MHKFSSLPSKTEGSRHIEHLEDLIFGYGRDGARQVHEYLVAIRSMLLGTSKGKYNVSVKWDGAPSIFAGVDPSDGRFFVAKKGFLNRTPQIYKTHDEIYDGSMPEELADKFSYALDYLPDLGITDVIQGDFLFTEDTLHRKIFEGEDYFLFHPNTIAYAVPAKSELGQRIYYSKLGVVWHTKYTGQTLHALKVEYNADICKNLKECTTVFCVDAKLKDLSGTVTLTLMEAAELSSHINNAETFFRLIDDALYDTLCHDPEIQSIVKMYCNARIRAGEDFTDSFQLKLIEFINARFDFADKKLSTIAGLEKSTVKRKAMIDKIMKLGEWRFTLLAEGFDRLIKAKSIILSKLNTIQELKMFLKTNSGYEVTGHEGFVASDHLGNAVKIVDRLTFSKANFNPEYLKGWVR